MEQETLDMTDRAAAAQAPVTDEELAALCGERARTYALLSRLFLREVDDELLGLLGNTSFPLGGDEEGDRGARLMVGFLDQAWENTPTELAVDYVRVFLGTGYDGSSAAYPYESVYTSEKHLLMQDAYSQVLACYRAAGVTKNEGTTELADHAGLELEFMKILCTRVRDALAAHDEVGAARLFEDQRAFVHDHLLSWMPALGRDMARFARTDFYRGLGAFTAGFLRSDAALLDELCSEGE